MDLHTIVVGFNRFILFYNNNIITLVLYCLWLFISMEVLNSVERI